MPALRYSYMGEMRRLHSSLSLLILAAVNTLLKTLSRGCTFATQTMPLVSRTIRVLRRILAMMALGALHGMLDRLAADMSFRLSSMMILPSISLAPAIPTEQKSVSINPMNPLLRRLRSRSPRLLSSPSLLPPTPPTSLTVPTIFARQKVPGRRLMLRADLGHRVRMSKYMLSTPQVHKRGSFLMIKMALSH